MEYLYKRIIFDLSKINLDKNNIFLIIISLLFPAIYLWNGIFPLDLILDLGDSGQFVWDLWIVDHLISQGKNPFSTNIAYWPVGVELTHHTLASGYYPLVWVVKKMFGEQYITYAISYNLSCWFSLSAVLFFTYKCLSKLNVPSFFAIIVATAYAFSPFFRGVWMNLNHVSGFFLPLITYFAIKIYQENKLRDLYALALISGISVYFTEFIAFIAIAIVLVIIVCFIIKSTRGRIKYLILNEGRMINNFTALFLAIIIAIPFYYAFFHSKIPGFGLEEQIKYSTNLAEYFFPGNNNSLIYPDWIISLGSFTTRDSSPIRFLGYPLLLLSIIALILDKKSFKYIGIVLFSCFLILGMGPWLKIFDLNTKIYLPYNFFWSMGLLPGFRTPERFNLVTVFALALLGGCGFKLLYLNIRTKSIIFANFIALFFTIWILIEPIRPVNIKKVWRPEQVLNHVDEGPVLHVPHAMIHGYIGLAQIIHKQPTLTGAVVRLSPKMNDQWWKLNNALKGEENSIVDISKKYDIKNLIIMPNTGLPPEMTIGMDSIIQTIAQNTKIKIIDTRTKLIRYSIFEEANYNINNLDLNRGVKIKKFNNYFKNNQIVKARQLEITLLQNGNQYKLEFYKDSVNLGEVLIPKRTKLGAQYHIIELPEKIQSGFDEIRVYNNDEGRIMGMNFRE